MVRRGMASKVMFFILSLVVVVFAYLPALGINFVDDIVNPPGTKRIVSSATLTVYGIPNGPYHWEIHDFTNVVRGDEPYSVAPLAIFPSGQVCARYKLYTSGNSLIESSTNICNPNEMELVSDSWDGSGWVFMSVPTGEYRVGVQFFENDIPVTNELRANVEVLE